MITRFQTSGAIAGIVKWLWTLRMPTASPVSPSSTTIGKSTWLSPIASSSSAGVNSLPVNTGTITGASRMKTIVITVSPTSSRPASAAASSKASLRFFCSSSSLNTGTKALESAASATSARTRFGIWNASVKAEAGPLVPKYAAATTSRNRPTTRESPVKTEKISVLTAVRRAGAVGWEAKPARYSTRLLRTLRGLFTMANIKSQIKRNNRAQRERFENRHYTSQIKTYFRRLETAVTDGDSDVIDAEHKKLVSLIDKAVKRGALHANTGARKKSRAERIRRAVPVA